MRSSCVRVDLGPRSYDVRIAAAGAAFVAASLSRLDRPLCVVTDVNVRARLWPAFATALRRTLGAVPPLVVVPAGERSKSPVMAARLHRALLRRGADRRTCVVAFGGGVVGDLAGYVAATYMRGIDWVVVPTTLLAMVDSAVGGKTGINLDGTKNIVGAFHQPRAVLVATEFLRTLSSRQRRSGLGEVVKYAMIADRALFTWLERDGRAWQRPRPRDDARLVARCCRIKSRFVAADEREAGARAALNFGHTLGHALEGDGRNGLLHGEAVGLGMLAACGIATRLGVAAPAQRARLAQLLDALGLPTRAAAGAGPAALRRAWRRDKKARGGRARFVLTPTIGAASLGHEVPDAMIVEALRGILTSHPVSNPLADARRERGGGEP